MTAPQCGIEQDERVADDGENVESDEGMPMAPAIDEQAAGIGVDRTEEIPQRVEETDDENRRAERLQIFRKEPHPQFLARADGEGGDEQDDEIALESEKLREALPSVHARSESKIRRGTKRVVATPLGRRDAREMATERRATDERSSRD